MNPYQISQDPSWHRMVDGIVILIIGFAAGVVLAGALMSQEITTTTEVTRRTKTVPQLESGTSTNLPSGARLEES